MMLPAETGVDPATEFLRSGFPFHQMFINSAFLPLNTPWYLCHSREMRMVDSRSISTDFADNFLRRHKAGHEGRLFEFTHRDIFR
jgi:hypothetical protein